MAFLLTSVAGFAQAGWTKVADNADAGVSLYVDRTTIHKVGNTAEMWSMSDYKAPREQWGKKFLSSKTRYEYDCGGFRWRQHNFTWHAGYMGQGNLVLSEAGKPSEWRNVIRETTAEIYWRAACGKE